MLKKDYYFWLTVLFGVLPCFEWVVFLGIDNSPLNLYTLIVATTFSPLLAVMMLTLAIKENRRRL